jgi:TatD DNase family protein
MSGTHAITVGVDLKTSKEAVEMANEYDDVHAASGLHPADNKDESFNSEAFAELAQRVDVIAVGECGLDYYRISEVDKEEKVRQEKEFRAQIEFAIEQDLALMLHVRPKTNTMDAYHDVIKILKEYKERHGDELRGNVHFFVGDMEVSKEFIDLGFTLSFTGILTFTNEYDDMVKETPLDMILTETDSPYATPVPHRGKRNEPFYVHRVVKRIAEIKGLSEGEVARAVVDNAYRIFSIG